MERRSSEMSENSTDADNYNETKKPQSASSKAVTPGNGSRDEIQNTAAMPEIVTDEDLEKIRADLQKSLQEEQMLVSLQMQLLLQLEKINSSIALAESEDKLAKLAIQQAQVVRALKKSRDPDSNADDETITIQLRTTSSS
eukprot:Nitzschia sp. Nitz4//scaffold21_size171442//14824//15246//NITZ4_002140-RA/size171442-processed-gene-0.38-mRNA-1//-1//CDS//3329542348//7823//frame0